MINRANWKSINIAPRQGETRRWEVYRNGRYSHTRATREIVDNSPQSITYRQRIGFNTYTVS